MLSIERHEQILQILMEKKSVTVGELSKTMFVSDATIRRDLSQMEKEGLIVLSENDGRRKTYLLTNAGMEALRAEYSRLRAMVRDGAWIGEGGTNEKTQL